MIIVSCVCVVLILCHCLCSLRALLMQWLAIIAIASVTQELFVCGYGVTDAIGISPHIPFKTCDILYPMHESSK